MITKRGQTWAYAMLGAPTKAVTLMITLYVPAFYAIQDGLGLVAVGLIFMGVRLFDIVIDPLFGALADRSSPPLGRRRFWIALGLPVLALSVWNVFRPPLPVAEPVFVFWLFILYLSWTIVTVSHSAWVTELTDEPLWRRRLIGWREWAGILGMMAVMIAPALQERHGVGLAGRMATIGISLAVAMLLFGLLALFLVPEPVAAKSTARVRTQLHYVLESAGLRRVLAADLAVGCGYGAASALMLLFVKTWLGVEAGFSIIMLVYFLGMLTSVPFWMHIADRLGARQTYRMALGLSAACQLAVLALPAGSPIAAGMLWLFQGILTGAYQFSLNTVMAEVVAHDCEGRTEARSGVYFALLATTNKIGYAIAIGIAFPLLQILGFSAHKMGASGLPVALTYALLPAFFFAASVFLIGNTRRSVAAS